MRNLKRALSLALASIMLLGMMVTGAGAASNSFTDFDQIVNQEAAEVTSGLKIFEGYTDGTFGPEKEVTRAEMAVIICKILNGANVDPANFSGLTKFTDVPSWAEGYVNYCNSMGIVVGVGDNKFDPNRTVSTVEAATMLLKALGYFVEEDQLKEDWKTVVTGRATSLKLYGDLTLGVDEPLTRDNVAELLFHTLFAQRVAYDDNRQLYVKNTNRDVVVTNGTEDKDNTLAMNTFGMWYIDGIVTGNSYTDDSLSETVNNYNRTDVVFDDAKDYMGGNVTHYPFEYTTGLDMIGHAARVYYSMERNAPVVYAIVDRATKVGYVSYSANTTDLANAANEAGFRRNTILQIDSDDYKVNYSWDSTVGTLKRAVNGKKVDLTGADSKTPFGHSDPSKTLVVISNSSDYTVDYVIVLDQYLDTVKRVVEKEEGNEYDLITVDGDDQNIPHDTFAQGDYVIVTDVGNLGKMFNLTAPERVSANITQITGVSNDQARVKSIIADGTTYAGSPVYAWRASRAEGLENTTNFESIGTIGEADLLLDFQGKCIGLAQPEAATNYAYAAQFGVIHDTNGALNTVDRLTVKLYFIDGTSGVYLVNTSDITGNTFKGYKYNATSQNSATTVVGDKVLLNGGMDNDVANTQYSPKKTYTNLSVNSSGVLNVGTGTGLGIYRVSVRADNTVVLYALSTNEIAAINKGDRLITGHSTLVDKSGANVYASCNEVMYQTAKTAYFYIDGSYTDDDLTVGTRTGLTNAVAITHQESDKDDNKVNEEFLQVFNTHNSNATVRDTVSAMLIYGIDLGANNDELLYREGSYHLNDRNGNVVADGENLNSRAVGDELTITYELYDANTGKKVLKTYDNGGKYYSMEVAKSTVATKTTGYYTLGSSDIVPTFRVEEFGDTNVMKLSPATATNPGEAKRVYILNADTEHTDYQDNIFTSIDPVGSVFADGDVIVVDTVDCGLNSVSAIARADAAGHTVRISYSYPTAGDTPYVTKVIFITDFVSAEDGFVNNKGFAPVYWDGSGNMKVRYHEKDFPLTQAYVANAVSAAMGYDVTNVILLGKAGGTVMVSGYPVPISFTTEEMFSVTYGRVKVYEKTGETTISKEHVGDLKLETGTNYLPVGTAAAAANTVATPAGTMALTAMTKDIVLAEAYHVSFAGGTVQTADGTNVNTNDFVAVGTKLDITGAATVGESSAITIADSDGKVLATSRASASGVAPTMTWTMVNKDVTISADTALTITAKGVDVHVVKQSGEKVTLTDGESTSVAEDDTYTVLSGANRYWTADGSTYAKGNGTGTVATNSIVIDGDYVKVTVGGAAVDPDAATLKGTFVTDASASYIKATETIQPVDDKKFSGVKMGTTNAYVAYGTTYGDADGLDTAGGAADGTVAIDSIDYNKIDVYGADGTVKKTVVGKTATESVASVTEFEGTLYYLNEVKGTPVAKATTVDASKGDVKVYSGYVKYTLTDATDANSTNMTAAFTQGTGLSTNDFFLKIGDTFTLTVTATAAVTSGSTGLVIDTKDTAIAIANVQATKGASSTGDWTESDLTVTSGALKVASTKVVGVGDQFVITYTVKNTDTALAPAITNT